MQRHGVALQVQADIGVTARHQFARRIVQRKLHPRGAGGTIDRLRGCLDSGRKRPVRIFRHGERGLGTELDRRHVVLRHVDIDAQLGDVGDHEHRRSRAAAGIDQRADIGVARGDDAVKRHRDLLVAGERFQPFDIGLAGIDGGHLVGEVGGTLIDFLRRNEIRGDQRLAPVQRRFRQSGARLLADEISSSLQQLLVEVRRLDLGDHLAGLDLRADIGAPAFQVARDAGQDRRTRIGLQPARQIDGGSERPAARQRHGDRRNRLFVGPFPQLGA